MRISDWSSDVCSSDLPSAVEVLATHGLVRPGAQALRVAQDRLAEKRFVCDLGGLTAPFAPVESLDDLQEALDRIGSRAILKTNRMGYDGKGRARLSDPGDAEIGRAACRERVCHYG